MNWFYMYMSHTQSYVEALNILLKLKNFLYSVYFTNIRNFIKYLKKKFRKAE